VTPAERWAVCSIHPTSHKIIGDLGQEITSCLGYEPLLSYLDSKHGLTESKLSNTTLTQLSTYLRGQKPHLHSNTVKLIHGWNLSYAILSHQGQCNSPLCPWCHITVETADHFLKCASPIARDSRKTLLSSFLTSVTNLGTDPMISYIFSYKLSNTLDIKSSFSPPPPNPNPHYKWMIMSAITHRNTLGWDAFLKGFMSSFWSLIQDQYPDQSNRPNPHWESSVVNLAIT